MAEDLNPSPICQPDTTVSNFEVEVQAEPTTHNDFEWSDVEIFDDHLFIKGIGASNLLSKDIRRICSVLKVKGVKNTSKEVMLQKLKDSFFNQKQYTRLSQEVNSRTRKEPQCSFRLLNILFTDEFSTKFAKLGDAANQYQLDTGKTGNDQYFWEEVCQAFQESNVTYDTLLFQEDDVFASLDLEMSVIINHSWQKLRSIWKSLNAEYKAALTKFTMSGTHTSDFYTFCNGKQDVYYLRKHLNLRPELTGTIEADLPSDTFIESDNVAKRLTLSEHADDTSPKRSKKAADAAFAVADALRDMSVLTQHAMFSERRIELLEKAEDRQQKEDDRKDREYLFTEWERVRENISRIRKELNAEKDETIREELQ